MHQIHVIDSFGPSSSGTAASKRRGNNNNNTATSNAMEMFPMTQDEFADHVSWDAEKPRLIVTETYLEDSPPLKGSFSGNDAQEDAAPSTTTNDG